MSAEEAKSPFDVGHISAREREALQGQADALSLTSFDRTAVAELLRQPLPVRSAARSALRYLHRARLLAKEMPELSMFCLLTAEEEAAMAIFRALRHRGYAGLAAVHPRDHRHKAALWPFLQGIARSIASLSDDVGVTSKPCLAFRLDPDTQQELLCLEFTLRLPDGTMRTARPLPPLHFSISSNGFPHQFRSELQKLAKEVGVRDIHRLIERRARQRNRILYAHESGVLEGPVDEQELSTRQDLVFMLLFFTLLIAQTPEQQIFVKEVLSVFGDLLGGLKRRPNVTASVSDPTNTTP